jgi:hypothetical protein
MPELRTEKLFQYGTWQDAQAMIFLDGTKLVFLGRNREMIAHFRYSDQIVTFEFFAARWDENLDPMDHWDVLWGNAVKSRLANEAKINSDQLKRIISNIEAALLEWPAAKVEARVPIKTVKFLTTP